MTNKYPLALLSLTALTLTCGKQTFADTPKEKLTFLQEQEGDSAKFRQANQFLALIKAYKLDEGFSTVLNERQRQQNYILAIALFTQWDENLKETESSRTPGFLTREEFEKGYEKTSNQIIDELFTVDRNLGRAARVAKMQQRVNRAKDLESVENAFGAIATPTRKLIFRPLANEKIPDGFTADELISPAEFLNVWGIEEIPGTSSLLKFADAWREGTNINDQADQETVGKFIQDIKDRLFKFDPDKVVKTHWAVQVRSSSDVVNAPQLLLLQNLSGTGAKINYERDEGENSYSLDGSINLLRVQPLKKLKPRDLEHIRTPLLSAIIKRRGTGENLVDERSYRVGYALFDVHGEKSLLSASSYGANLTYKTDLAADTDYIKGSLYWAPILKFGDPVDLENPNKKRKGFWMGYWNPISKSLLAYAAPQVGYEFANVQHKPAGSDLEDFGYLSLRLRTELKYKTNTSIAYQRTYNRTVSGPTDNTTFQEFSFTQPLDKKERFNFEISHQRGAETPGEENTSNYVAGLSIKY